MFGITRPHEAMKKLPSISFGLKTGVAVRSLNAVRYALSRSALRSMLFVGCSPFALAAKSGSPNACRNCISMRDAVETLMPRLAAVTLNFLVRIKSSRS